MVIVSLDDYIAGKKQIGTLYKSASAATLAAVMGYTVFDLAGNPGLGVLDVGNTPNGLVHTDEVAGYPIINAFGEGAIGYLSKVEFSSPVACRLALYDRLFVAGAYPYNTDTILESQPNFASRVPYGSDFNGLELWAETTSAFSGTPSFRIDYLDQDGNDGDTGVIAAPAALTIRRCFQIPLASGDNGIQKVTRVRCTVAAGGYFNVMVLRPLWSGRVGVINHGEVHDFLRTGLVQVFADSALYLLVAADSTASSTPTIHFEIVNK